MNIEDSPYYSLKNYIKMLYSKLKYLEQEMEFEETISEKFSHPTTYSKEDYNIFRNTLIELIKKLQS